MVKRPYPEQSLSRVSTRRSRVEQNVTNTDTSDESDVEDVNNQTSGLASNFLSDEGDNDSPLPSPTLEPPNQPVEEDIKDPEDGLEIAKPGSEFGAMSDEGDASDGSSEGSSVDDPDENFEPLSPPETSKNFRELKGALEDEDEDSSASDNDSESDKNLEERDPPLYHGAPITLNESMLSILALTFTHNLSRSCLDDVLQLIAIHCPSFNLCKENTRLFKKHFAKSKSLVVRHYYCTSCFESLKHKNQMCGQCNKHRGITFFAEVPILSQLEVLYSRPGFHRMLLHRFKRSKLGVSTYDDIYDGQVYKNLCSRGNILADGNNISFTWYTDGLRLSKSAENEIWPFYLTINELPFSERHKPENVLLAGIWFGPHKPVPHLFLKGIREDFHSLNKGVQFRVPGQPEPILVRGVVICGTCDISAKALFLNISHPLSTFGCQKCKIRSVRKGNHTVYKFERFPKLRTYQETLLHAEKSIKARRSVYGVKGTSALSFVYKPIETTAIDMHDAYIGVSKILNKVHFSEEHYQHPASLFGFLHLYDRRLSAIRPPYYVEKLPRPFSGFGADWEPSELKVNLMIYSLPLLQDIMSVFHFEHHMLLVYGLYLLSKDTVSEQCLELASEMLTDYCSRFEDLYGDEFMSCYVHQLMHLPTVVKDFGPLWVTSCAPYEALNETLRRFSQGINQEENQVMSAASLFLHVSKLKPVQPSIGRPAHAFCEKLSLSRSGQQLEVHSVHGHFCVVGKMRHTPVLPEILYVAIAPLKLTAQNYCMFDRILNTRRNILFSSSSFDQGSKNVSCCVKYQKNNGAFFGRVHSYLRVTDCKCTDVCTNCDDPDFYAIIHKLHVQPAYRAEPGGFIPFIHRCAEMNEYEAVRIECLSFVCFLIEIADRHDAFVVEPITTGQIE
ncbi:hypothetical protein ONE63_005754 [Megalurothrips usitatus]|uniref:Transposase domain-containing protein n=1 Tax=Megalurothrips usitatus TaxID=439358 RepID=A0AAV7Y3F3_9NEOP|nr:hypothetical protein ONE63_005754 [Megalurothrips usitatus]